MRTLKLWLSIGMVGTLMPLCVPGIFEADPPLIIYPIWGFFLATLAVVVDYLRERGESRRNRSTRNSE